MSKERISRKRTSRELSTEIHPLVKDFRIREAGQKIAAELNKKDYAEARECFAEAERVDKFNNPARTLSDPQTRELVKQQLMLCFYQAVERNDIKTILASIDNIMVRTESCSEFLFQEEAILIVTHQKIAQAKQKQVDELIQKAFEKYRYPAEGLFYLKEALEVDPFNDLAWFESGQCYVALGDLPQALRCYEQIQAEEVEGRNVSTVRQGTRDMHEENQRLLLASEEYLKKGEFEEAEHALDVILSTSPCYDSVLQRLEEVKEMESAAAARKFLQSKLSYHLKSINQSGSSGIKRNRAPEVITANQPRGSLPRACKNRK